MNQFALEMRHIWGHNLMSIYLHGSLAFGCFNLKQNNIDLLVFIKERMPVDTKRRVAQLLLQCSANPRPIEVSFLSQDQLVPWRFPTPYDFHYSEEWRERVRLYLQKGTTEALSLLPSQIISFTCNVSMRLLNGMTVTSMLTC